jgi:hypothetical protein
VAGVAHRPQGVIPRHELAAPPPCGCVTVAATAEVRRGVTFGIPIPGRSALLAPIDRRFHTS